MSDSQSYAGTGGTSDAANEWARTNFMVRQIMAGMATAAIVMVKAVNGQTVDVQPMVNQLDGSGNAVAHGTIHNLPFCRPQSGTWGIIIDPVVGDIGLAVFAHSDTSSVKANKAVSNPGSRRKFDWADGIYVCGMLNPDPENYIKLYQSGELEINNQGPIRVTSQGIVQITANMVMTSSAFAAGNGATGTFTSKEGKVVTVISGIITSIM